MSENIKHAIGLSHGTGHSYVSSNTDKAEHADVASDGATVAPLQAPPPFAIAGDGFDPSAASGDPVHVAGGFGLQLGDPVLPPMPPKAEQASRAGAASAVLDGLAYRQRHLAEAIHVLTSLASARMEAVGRTKVAYGKSQARAALQAAELELKSVKDERGAMWMSTSGNLAKLVGEALPNPLGRFAGGALGQAVNTFDKNFGYQRAADDARWQKSYIALRERINKQLEDLQSGEYDKSIRLLERTLETTRQMATGNTDTLKSISNNL